METASLMDVITTVVVFMFARLIYKEIRGFFKVNNIVEFLKREGILCDTRVPTQIDRVKDWQRKGGPWADPDNPYAQTIFKPCKSRRQTNESIDNSSPAVD